ncbi:hypothetical protein HaLaN_33026, partial [Haematococcus lacustris]
MPPIADEEQPLLGLADRQAGLASPSADPSRPIATDGGGAGACSWLLLSWFTPLMRCGAQRQLQASDLLELEAALRPGSCSSSLDVAWQQAGGSQ